MLLTCNISKFQPIWLLRWKQKKATFACIFSLCFHSDVLTKTQCHSQTVTESGSSVNPQRHLLDYTLKWPTKTRLLRTVAYVPTASGVLIHQSVTVHLTTIETSPVHLNSAFISLTEVTDSFTLTIWWCGQSWVFLSTSPNIPMQQKYKYGIWFSSGERNARMKKKAEILKAMDE